MREEDTQRILKKSIVQDDIDCEAGKKVGKENYANLYFFPRSLSIFCDKSKQCSCVFGETINWPRNVRFKESRINLFLGQRTLWYEDTSFGCWGERGKRNSEVFHS